MDPDPDGEPHALPILTHATAAGSGLDQLFTPWRLAYVTDVSRTTPACIFCDALARAHDPLIAYRGPLAFVILNKYPYNNGHVMVVPNRHIGRLADLRSEEIADVMSLAQAVERALTAMYTPHGFNLGLNIGKPAGAGVLDHLHLHIVPRWNGDTSFMSIIGETRVLPEELPVTAARLTRALTDILDPTP